MNQQEQPKCKKCGIKIGFNKRTGKPEVTCLDCVELTAEDHKKIAKAMQTKRWY